MQRLALLSLAALSAVGCDDDLALPYELDHARILAVRAEPAALRPGQVGTLEVLFTDASAQPRLAEPHEFSLSLPASLGPSAQLPELQALRALLRRDADGWRLEAPDAATLQTARAALGLGDDAPLLVPVLVRLTTADGPLLAEKLVPLGATAANPAPPQIRVDREPVDESVLVSRGSEPSVAVADALPELSYRWFTSLGELRHYTEPAAQLEALQDPARDQGVLLVIARDAFGGVAWKLVTAEVTPR